MVDIVKNGKKVKSEFKKETWTQAINNVKMATHFSNVIILEKIKNKLQFLKQLWKKWIRLDEKVLKWEWDNLI